MRIFILSLTDAKERRDAITKKMNTLGLDFEFFDAIDGRAGLPEKYEAIVDRKKAKKRLGKDVSDGEISCALSHAFVYKKIADDNIACAIVLEDDAIISDDFAQMVQQKVCEQSGKDFIYLYHLYARAMIGTRSRFFDAYNTVKLAKTPNGAVAYYITLDTAKKLYDAVMPISWVSDWGVDIVGKFNCVAITPRIVKHPPMEKSHLEVSRTGKKATFGQFDFLSWLCYKLKKVLSYKISSNV